MLRGELTSAAEEFKIVDEESASWLPSLPPTAQPLATWHLEGPPLPIHFPSSYIRDSLSLSYASRKPFFWSTAVPPQR